VLHATSHLSLLGVCSPVHHDLKCKVMRYMVHVDVEWEGEREVGRRGFGEDDEEDERIRCTPRDQMRVQGKVKPCV